MCKVQSKVETHPHSSVSDSALHQVAAIGIDVSKDKLDVQLLRSSEKNAKTSYKQFANSPAGFAKLVRWVDQLLSQINQTNSQKGQSRKPHYCLESTGAYSQALAQFLAEEGHLVSVVNPFLIKHYGVASGMLTKNDKADARVIAHYCRAESPEPWHLSRPEVRALVALVRRLQGLEQHLQQEKNRIQEPGLIKPVVRSLQKTIRFLEKEIASLKEEIRRHIDSDEGPDGLKKSKDLLLSIPGIGETLATSILAELPDVSTFESASSAAAYAGLSPKENKSGTSVNKKTRIARKGNAHLRCALFMPALSAFRCNPLLADLYQRLLSRGLSRKAAVCAVMRKLLMLAYGVLKSRQTFQLDWAQCQAAKRQQRTSQLSAVSA
jgi:transposase